MKAKINELFDLSHSLSGEYLSRFTYPWEALDGIGNFILELIKNLPESEYDAPSPDIRIAKDASVSPTAFIKGPCIVGHNAEVRHCAFIRGNALIGENCVVGNSVELKNVILFDNVQVPHYNYIGDSILGFKAHFGAGSLTSNVKSDKQNVVIKSPEEQIPTNRKKVGAMVGDFAEIGCNAVLNPGTVIGRNTNVYPLTSVRGFVPENSIKKSDQTTVLKR